MLSGPKKRAVEPLMMMMMKITIIIIIIIIIIKEIIEAVNELG
jgi:hypothetical protein